MILAINRPCATARTVAHGGIWLHGAPIACRHRKASQTPPLARRANYFSFRYPEAGDPLLGGRPPDGHYPKRKCSPVGNNFECARAYPRPCARPRMLVSWPLTYSCFLLARHIRPRKLAFRPGFRFRTHPSSQLALVEPTTSVDSTARFPFVSPSPRSFSFRVGLLASRSQPVSQAAARPPVSLAAAISGWPMRFGFQLNC